MFIISHPGTGELTTHKTFNNAMKYFEGHNIPRKVINGKEEDFKISIKRVELYLMEKK